MHGFPQGRDETPFSLFNPPLELFLPDWSEVFTFFSFKTWMDSIQFLSFRPSFRIFAFALCSAPHFPRGCLAESALSGCYLRISGGASAELAFFLRL
jgi:hypothetical protein